MVQQDRARLRPELSGMATFVPSRAAPGTIDLVGTGAGKAFGPLPSVRAAMHKATHTVGCYPDNDCTALKSALAKQLDTGIEQLAVGCGSVSLCQQLIQLTASVGDEVMFGWPSFGWYGLQVRIAGATAVQVPLTNHTLDLDAMLAAVTERTRLILVCNPNNPTSTAVDPNALARFVKAVPPHVVIAIDEAYVEYIRDGFVPDSMGLVRAHHNVVVLRTFSKAYGLAGARVGYALAHPEVIAGLNNVSMPFTMTDISQAAAVASVHAVDELLTRTDAVVAERIRVSAALRDVGFSVPPSQASFVFLVLGAHSADFVEQAANAGIVVRAAGSYGVPVTLSTSGDNDALLRFARDWMVQRDNATFVFPGQAS